MLRPTGILVASCVGLLLLGSAAPLNPQSAPARSAPAASKVAAASFAPSEPIAPPGAASAPAQPPPPAPPTTQEALKEGVLVVVSIPSQTMFVFKDGEVWDSSPVSTGRPGYDTPAGVFPILQKKVHHRSNLYDDAPMPYMQRLTWGGVALHAGHVPGYPASHGCIRLPREFARKLYAITDFSSTAVLIADEPLSSAEEARQLGGGRAITPPPVRAADLSRQGPPARDGRTQTIQLAASGSPHKAAALWQELLQRRPELHQLRHEIIPATVHARQVFRLRASGADAHAICRRLASGGVDCLAIRP